MGVLNKEFNWIDEEVVGMALLLLGESIDSLGNEINGSLFYEVGKHKKTGQVAILPTHRSQKHEL
ncbi:hypothetical protein JYU20_00700 [Bacteroidales bacterium AH-315-I05]|nr:hypothetical protein [Bacteroidales bacterium AH-315-I05]